MKNNQRGFVAMYLGMIIVVALLFGGGYVYVTKEADKTAPTVQPVENTPVATSSNLSLDSEPVSTEPAAPETIPAIVETSSPTVEKTVVAKTEKEVKASPSIQKTQTSQKSIKEEFNTEGTTLCQAPRNIDGYVISTAYVTNEPSQATHSSYWNTKTGSIYNSINPGEHLLLNYAKGATKVNVYVYRFETAAKLNSTFIPILGFTNDPIQKYVQPESGVKGYLKYIYKNQNNLVEVVGESEKDITNIAEQVMSTCLPASVFKTNTPDGYTAWRSKDQYSTELKNYQKITNTNITLYLENKYFGVNPFIRDYPLGDLSGMTIEGKVMLYGISTVDLNKRMRPLKDINMFVLKTTDKPTLISFLIKYECLSGLGCAELDYTVTGGSDMFNTDSGLSVERMLIHKVSKQDSSDTLEHFVYFVTKNDTTFAFVIGENPTPYIDSLLEALKFE